MITFTRSKEIGSKLIDWFKRTYITHRSTWVCTDIHHHNLQNVLKHISICKISNGESLSSGKKNRSLEELYTVYRYNSYVERSFVLKLTCEVSFLTHFSIALSLLKKIYIYIYYFFFFVAIKWSTMSSKCEMSKCQIWM